MIEASGEEGDSDEEKEIEPPAECPAHKTTIKTAKGVMTDSEVFANSIGFLIAGNETTSTALSYTSYLLALNPDVQEKLQSEIDAYFDEKPVSYLLKEVISVCGGTGAMTFPYMHDSDYTVFCSDNLLLEPLFNYNQDTILVYNRVPARRSCIQNY